MKNKNKLTFKIIAGTVAVTLICFILFVTNAFVGNPISQRMANKAIQKYVDKNYSSMNLEVEKAKYDFKEGAYIGMAKSKTSIDTKFRVCYRNGKIAWDDYESYVLGMFNTPLRLEEEYSAIAKNIITKELGYDNTTIVNFEKGESFNDLKLDMKFDKSLFINPEVIIRLDSPENSIDFIAKVLTDAHKAFLDKDCKFVKYGLYVQNDDYSYVDVNCITPADIEGGELVKLLENAKDNRSGSGISVLIKGKNK